MAPTDCNAGCGSAGLRDRVPGSRSRNSTARTTCRRSIADRDLGHPGEYPFVARSLRRHVPHAHLDAALPGRLRLAAWRPTSASATCTPTARTGS